MSLSSKSIEHLSDHHLGSAIAIANVNIALIKYWGKLNIESNVPAVGSLSLTLDGWGSETNVTWFEDKESMGHRFILNEQERSDQKVNKLLDHLLDYAEHEGHQWAKKGKVRAVVRSLNSVPTASGLASSASGMAALGLAAWSSLGWNNPLEQVSIDQTISLIDLVRIGSGSAVRSLKGGLVRLESDGRTMTQLCAPNEWSLALVVCIVDPGPKATSSREGMERTRLTSPYYDRWVDSHQDDLDAATDAVTRRDLEQLGDLMEHSTFKMHAAMWGSKPPLRYLKAKSFMILDEVERLRADGVRAWSTMDAGPHVKILCDRSAAKQIADHMRGVIGKESVLVRYPGRAARLIEGEHNV